MNNAFTQVQWFSLSRVSNILCLIVRRDSQRGHAQPVADFQRLFVSGRAFSTSRNRPKVRDVGQIGRTRRQSSPPRRAQYATAIDLQRHALGIFGSGYFSDIALVNRLAEPRFTGATLQPCDPP